VINPYPANVENMVSSQQCQQMGFNSMFKGLITHFKTGSKTVITIAYSSSKLRAIIISTQSDK
jgi:hypothetical protein